MRLPAEWERQKGIWLSWPARNSHWTYLRADEIQQQWALIAATISRTQSVFINIDETMRGDIENLLNTHGAERTNIHLYDHPHDDVWCRDHGAIFIEDEGGIIATDWGFNGWGEQFPPWQLDNQIPPLMAQSQGLTCRSYPEILEGGAIESNGAGTMMTTEAVLLNKNRNPHLNKADLETLLHSRLGIEHVIWLGDGIVGDDTGGHIDDIARFTATDTILISSDPHGPNKESLTRNYHLLKEQSAASVIKLPMPEACNIPGWRLPTLPASYVNFLITNESVLVPTFRQEQNDDRALGTLREHFPSREVIGIDALDLVSEGGALHCISMQQPSLE